MASQPPYTTLQMTLHWTIAVIILSLAFSGLAYAHDLLDNRALIFHQIGGQVLILLLIVRIAIKLQRGAPAPSAHHSRLERGLAYAVHLGLYGVMIAFTATGLVAASALSNPFLVIPLDRGFARSDLGEQILYVHFALKWVLLALFVLHLAGTLKHAIIDRDGTLARMLPHKN